MIWVFSSRKNNWLNFGFEILISVLMFFFVCDTNGDREGRYAFRSKATDRSCPLAFNTIGHKCYFYGYFRLNWFRAAEFCHSFGSSVALAVLDEPVENARVKQWLSKNGDPNTGVWIGGSDNGHRGRWAWFPTGQLIDYSNWGPSQPSGGDQHCLYLVGGILGYQWADFHCEFDMNFLCEMAVAEAHPF